MRLTKEQQAKASSPGGWGTHGSVEMQRYSKRITGRGGRGRCCAKGCDKRASHLGMANGLALCSCCEWHVNVWVKDGYEAILTHQPKSGEPAG